MHVFYKRRRVESGVPGSLKQGKMLDPLHAIITVVKSAHIHFNVGENSTKHTQYLIRCHKMLVFTKASQYSRHIGIRPL